MKQAHSLNPGSTEQNRAFHGERATQARVLGELLFPLGWLVPGSNEARFQVSILSYFSQIHQSNERCVGRWGEIKICQQ